MKKKIELSGTVKYLNLEMGFWGIVDQKGGQWQPVNFPEQLKLEGAAVKLVVREKEEQASFQMWGRPVEILSFHTLGPAPSA